jgi:hypothetical protein
VRSRFPPSVGDHHNFLNYRWPSVWVERHRVAEIENREPVKLPRRNASPIPKVAVRRKAGDFRGFFDVNPWHEVAGYVWN